MTDRTFSVSNTATTTLVTTAETVVATLSGISTRNASEQVNFRSRAEISWGTGTTSGVVRIRRGTGITGTLVSTQPLLTVAAGNVSGNDPVAIDTPGEVANQSYVLTVQQTAATGNGSVTLGQLQATIGVNASS